MATKKVYFNASGVAGAIGLMEPYKPQEEEKKKVLLRYDPNSFHRLYPESQVANIELCLNYLTCEELKKQEAPISEQRKNTISTEEFNTLMANSEVSAAIAKRVDSVVAIAQGIAQEDKDLDKFAEETKKEVTERNTKMRYFEAENYILGGKIDGLSTDDEGAPVVIENKHRKNRLFKKLRMYERVQLFVYMKITGAKKAILVENYKNQSASQEVEWNDAEWGMYADMIAIVAKDIIELCNPVQD